MRLRLAGILALAPGAAWASAFSGLPSAGGAAPVVDEGFWGSVTSAVYALQAGFYQQMNGALGEMRADSAAGIYLIAFAFLYGVFHAAGPGHGKVVVSSYVLADRLTLKKGVLLSFLSALVQGAVAVALISVAAIALRFTRSELMNQAGYLEKASFILIAALGVLVIARALRPYLAGAVQPRLAGAGGHGHHGNHDHHGHHHHSHGDSCGCGHAHMPAASQAAALSGPAEFAAAAFSIGLRPCTGALVVLVFALAQGLYGAGVAAVLAMSLGTAITVSLIAVLAVAARDTAQRLWGRNEARSRKISLALQITGGVALLFFGLIMALGPVQGG